MVFFNSRKLTKPEIEERIRENDKFIRKTNREIRQFFKKHPNRAKALLIGFAKGLSDKEEMVSDAEAENMELRRLRKVM